MHERRFIWQIGKKIGLGMCPIKPMMVVAIIPTMMQDNMRRTRKGKCSVAAVAVAAATLRPL